MSVDIVKEPRPGWLNVVIDGRVFAVRREVAAKLSALEADLKFVRTLNERFAGRIGALTAQIADLEGAVAMQRAANDAF